jgi:hypothetical protein
VPVGLMRLWIKTSFSLSNSFAKFSTPLRATWLALAARERHVCEVHAGRLRAVRMTIVLIQSFC